MTLDEIRQQWLLQSEQMRAEVLRRYSEQRISSGGREGLGVYGIYQERIARKKVQLAVKLLKKNRFDPSIGNIHKITQQSRPTIQRHMPARVSQTDESERIEKMPDNQLAEVIRLSPS